MRGKRDVAAPASAPPPCVRCGKAATSEVNVSARTGAMQEGGWVKDPKTLIYVTVAACDACAKSAARIALEYLRDGANG